MNTSKNFVFVICLLRIYNDRISTWFTDFDKLGYLQIKKIVEFCCYTVITAKLTHNLIFFYSMLNNAGWNFKLLMRRH